VRLKIAIAARGLYSHFGGPNEYIQGFVSEFVKQSADQHEIFLYYNTPVLLGRFPKAIERALPFADYLIWDHLVMPRQLRRDGIDLAIYPKSSIPLWSPCRSAAIMLDLGYFYPELNAYKTLNTIYMRMVMRHTARKAWAIFAISEFTRQDVIRILGASPGNVKTIHGAASTRFRPVTDQATLKRVSEKYGLVVPYIFYPASLSPRKNFPRLLDAFESVLERLPHHLYFTGNIAWKTNDTIRRLKGPLSARVHRLGSVPPEDMPALYTLAQFVIYPSLFEGLGLPVLEAFQCGTPIIISNRSCLPEVAGDAALLIDPYSVESIEKGILRLAADGALRENLRRAGSARIQEFTWEKTVKVVLDWIESRWGN
jgi:glycosyltransferase involved in cell wall biosynthesis